MKGALALRVPCGTPVMIDTSSTNITSASWVQLQAAASMNSACSAILVSNSGAQPLLLGTGASGSEVSSGAVIPPSSAGVLVPIKLATATRLSLKSLDGTQSTGIVTVMFLQ